MLVILRGERINCSGALALFKDNTLDLFNFSKEKSWYENQGFPFI